MKHPFAIYYDEYNKKNTLHPKDLHDKDKRKIARENELWDEKQEIRLYVRYNEKTPHFFTTREGRAYYGREENDPAHNARVDKILNNLTGAKIKVGFNSFSPDKEPTLNPLANIAGYKWEKEVYRVVSKTGICRHDIFGIPDQVTLTQKQPWIAIEVIKTHYPSQAAFDAMIALSDILPLLVIFDFVEVPNYFFQITQNARITHYIYGGRVWSNDTEWKKEDCTASNFQSVMENKIKQQIQNKKYYLEKQLSNKT